MAAPRPRPRGTVSSQPPWLALARRVRPPPWLRRRSAAAQAALRLVGGLAVLVALGTVLLWLPLSGRTRALTFDEALFTAVSALSTTGLSVISPGRDLSTFGQVILLLLMQVGGIGFMVGAVIVFRLLGRRVALEERLALQDAVGAVSTEAVLRLAGRVLAGVMAIEAVGALVLWLRWQPAFGSAPAAFLAIFHAVAAFTNASFDLFSGTPDAPAGFPTDAATLITLSLLVIIGGLGIPVILELTRRRGRRLSLHTRLTLITSAALLALGTLALFVGESQPGALFGSLPWPRRLLLAYFHSAASRTAGFVLQPLEAMIPPNVLALIVLMFIGGAPASTSGGITTSTFAVLALAMWNYLRGRTTITVGGRAVPQETLLKAVAIVMVALGVVMTVTWLLLLTQPTTLSQALFEAVSAFATAGFSLGLTPHLDLFGRLLIAATMFWGRLGALTVVVALTRRSPPAPVSYPEERILIG